MEDVGEFAAVALPRGMEPGDLTSLVDQLEKHAEAVVAHKGKKKPAEAKAPEGVEPVEALPAQVGKSLVRLIARRNELRVTIQSRDTLPDDTPDVARATANAQSDQAWRAFEGWLTGWTSLDDGQKPDAHDAHALYLRVFPAPDGLRFITWRPRKQWEAMKTRMQALGEKGSRAMVEGLGGARFLARLEKTHAAFGQAYGFTRATDANPEAATDTRPQWLAAQDALRDYVRKTSSLADPEVPGSAALAGYLLQPFTALVSEFAARPHPKPAAKPTPPSDGGTKPA